MTSDMPPLNKTNKYIADPVARRALLHSSALNSSAFDGARGLVQRATPQAKGRSVASVKQRASRA